MREASKPFVWWLLEYLFGSDVRVPVEPVKVDEKETPWEEEITG